MNRKTGFTLIELLVVIAIMGLLASVVFASLNNARKKARVARTLIETDQIFKVLQFYFDDTGLPPPHDHSWGTSCEHAVFVDGVFSPKPSGWDGPYLAAWPTTQWNNAYHWERWAVGQSQCGSDCPAYSISIQSVPPDEAQMMDDTNDDGDLATGKIRSSGGGRVEVFFDAFGFPDIDTTTTSC